MKDKVAQMLSEMQAQAAYFDEQLKMTRGAIQILELLLAQVDEGVEADADEG